MTEEKIKQLIAELVGIEVGEIELSDSLREDYHMSPTDLAELMHQLLELGANEEKLDLSEIETVSELVEALKQEEEI
jgi:acyl carrier protein